MAICKKCGTEVDDNSHFCPKCGESMTEEKTTTEENTKSEEQQNAFMKWIDTEDFTNTMDKQDIEDNKALAILSYIGPLVFVPLFAAKKSKFAQFHANQGLTLFIMECIISVISVLLALIPYVGGVLSALISLISVPFVVAGIINAAKGNAKILPCIGHISVLKNK